MAYYDFKFFTKQRCYDGKCYDEDLDTDESLDKLYEYIHSLENRIEKLEQEND